MRYETIFFFFMLIIALGVFAQERIDTLIEHTQPETWVASKDWSQLNSDDLRRDGVGEVLQKVTKEQAVSYFSKDKFPDGVSLRELSSKEDNSNELKLLRKAYPNLNIPVGETFKQSWQSLPNPADIRVFPDGEGGFKLDTFVGDKRIVGFMAGMSKLDSEHMISPYPDGSIGVGHLVAGKYHEDLVVKEGSVSIERKSLGSSVSGSKMILLSPDGENTRFSVPSLGEGGVTKPTLFGACDSAVVGPRSCLYINPTEKTIETRVTNGNQMWLQNPDAPHWKAKVLTRIEDNSVFLYSPVGCAGINCPGLKVTRDGVKSDLYGSTGDMLKELNAMNLETPNVNLNDGGVMYKPSPSAEPTQVARINPVAPVLVPVRSDPISRALRSSQISETDLNRINNQGDRKGLEAFQRAVIRMESHVDRLGAEVEPSYLRAVAGKELNTFYNYPTGSKKPITNTVIPSNPIWWI